MSRKHYSSSRKLVLAAALVLAASSAAIADDTSTNRFGGDGYAYFSQPVRGNVTVVATWRQSHPNGPSERDLQAASSSSLATWQLSGGASVGSAQNNVAQTSSKATSSTRK